MTNLLFALLVLSSSPKGPEAYYYSGTKLEPLNVIECANARGATFTFLIRSYYELRSAEIDSNEVRMCLPEVPMRKQLRLSGTWYIITFATALKVGSTRHVLRLTSYTGRVHKRCFTINVEGTQRLKKPMGVEK